MILCNIIISSVWTPKTPVIAWIEKTTCLKNKQNHQNGLVVQNSTKRISYYHLNNDIQTMSEKSHPS